MGQRTAFPPPVLCDLVRAMKRPLLIVGIVVGGLLMLGPVIGMFAMGLGMQRAFHELERSGVQDPQHLSAAIGEVLLSAIAGLVVLPVGILTTVLCIIFLVKHDRKTPPPLPAIQ